MIFSKFEDTILKEYKNKLKTDNSVKNIVKVFIKNYLKERKNITAGKMQICYFSNTVFTIGVMARIWKLILFDNC
nr:hypothetical protein [Treponema socranskii]